MIEFDDQLVRMRELSYTTGFPYSDQMTVDCYIEIY